MNVNANVNRASDSIDITCIIPISNGGDLFNHFGVKLDSTKD